MNPRTRTIRLDKTANAVSSDPITPLTVAVVSAYVSHNALSATDVAKVISEIHAASA